VLSAQPWIEIMGQRRELDPTPKSEILETTLRNWHRDLPKCPELFQKKPKIGKKKSTRFGWGAKKACGLALARLFTLSQNGYGDNGTPSLQSIVPIYTSMGEKRHSSRRPTL